MMGRSRFDIKTICAATMVFAATVLVSCNRRPLEDPDFSTRIDVKVNISAIANVTCDIYNRRIPVPQIECEVMRVVFFDTKNDKMVGESFISDIGTDPETGEKTICGDISILPGDYRMLLYTFGTESTIVENYNSWSGSRAVTSTLSEAATKALSIQAKGKQKINYQPDHLLLAVSEHESIPYHAGVYTIRAKASSVVESYYLQVKVQGLEYVSSAMATLSSMSPSVQLSKREMDKEEPVTIYIPLVKSEDDGTAVICNVFNTFGRIPESRNDLDVTFDLKTIDGRTISKTFDISDLFLSEDCINHHWLLVEETIDVPPPENPGPTGGGGFDPTVGDWEEEHHELEL